MTFTAPFFTKLRMFNSNTCISYTKFQPYWTAVEEIYTLHSSMAFGAPSFTKCILLNSVMWEFYILNFIPLGQQAKKVQTEYCKFSMQLYYIQYLTPTCYVIRTIPVKNLSCLILTVLIRDYYSNSHIPGLIPLEERLKHTCLDTENYINI